MKKEPTPGQKYTMEIVRLASDRLIQQFDDFVRAYLDAYDHINRRFPHDGPLSK